MIPMSDDTFWVKLEKEGRRETEKEGIGGGKARRVPREEWNDPNRLNSRENIRMRFMINTTWN